MAVTFRILPRFGLVYIRYVGVFRVAETLQAFASYMAHPDFAPGQKQLVDLSAVTGADMDIPAILQMQAQKADAFLATDAQTLIAYYAPTFSTGKLAWIAQKSWDGVDAVVSRVLTRESDVLDFLGLPVAGFDALMARAE